MLAAFVQRHHQSEPRQQPLRRYEPRAGRRAGGAAAYVAGYALAPQGRGHLVPVGDQVVQGGAAGFGGEGPDDRAPDVELVLDPLDAYGGVLGREAEGVRQLGPGELPRRLQPPQREHIALRLVEPAGRLGGLAPLAGELQAQDGQVDEVGGRVGRLVGLLQRGGAVAEDGPAGADLVHGDGHQPGPEPGGIAQRGEAGERAEHGLLHHVVHVRVAVEGAAHDVVDERQVEGGEPLPGRLVPVPGRDDQCGDVHAVHAVHHVLTSSGRAEDAGQRIPGVWGRSLLAVLLSGPFPVVNQYAGTLRAPRGGSAGMGEGHVEQDGSRRRSAGRGGRAERLGCHERA
ncbi:protein of unknown function [Streptomyces sp. KY75]|nr:protein of unknown function [Streptomyces sp. KY75]CAD5980424.1 protein of unknown function [Streptomyces sp. KY70]